MARLVDAKTSHVYLRNAKELSAHHFTLVGACHGPWQGQRAALNIDDQKPMGRLSFATDWFAPKAISSDKITQDFPHHPNHHWKNAIR